MHIYYIAAFCVPADATAENLRLKQFRLHLAQALIGDYYSHQKTGRPCNTSMPLPQPVTHSPSHFPLKWSQKQQCAYCNYSRHPPCRRESRWYCGNCEGNPTVSHRDNRWERLLATMALGTVKYTFMIPLKCECHQPTLPTCTCSETYTCIETHMRIYHNNTKVTEIARMLWCGCFGECTCLYEQQVHVYVHVHSSAYICTCTTYILITWQTSNE